MELMYFRKVNGASEVVLGGLASTETCLKKARKTVSKMMPLQWTIDTLESKRHWARLEELLEVVVRFLHATRAYLDHARINQVQCPCWTCHLLPIFWQCNLNE